jgi:hypothetical protein
MANFDLNDYVQVNERIELFYKDHPQGSIQTELIFNQDGQAIIKAYIYRDQEDKRPCTGHAMEKEGSTYINKTSHIENCETSAVGRALALMGYEIKKSVASREEVANARLNQCKPQPSAPKKATQQDALKPLELKCAGCGAEINQAVKAFSEKNFGKPLCMNCQKVTPRKEA